MSDTEAPAAPAPVAAAPGSFTVETAVQVKNLIFWMYFIFRRILQKLLRNIRNDYFFQDVLKQGAIQDGLSRGLNEAVRALERKDALIWWVFFQDLCFRPQASLSIFKMFKI